MTTCARCGELILFGGKRDGDSRYCKDRCLHAARSFRLAAQLPDSVVTARVWEVYYGQCPKCAGPGPVDVHLSYRVWSALIMSSFSTRPHVCCRRCGQKARVKDAGFSLVFGWWGIPWGLPGTPVQVVRNLLAILRQEDSAQPSRQLFNLVSIQLAEQMLEKRGEKTEERTTGGDTAARGGSSTAGAL
jgi:hypothetical protein